MSDPYDHKVIGIFGQIKVSVDVQAVLLGIIARNYTRSGILLTDYAHLRLPLNDAIRLHAALATAITAADVEPRQPGLWSDATVRSCARRLR